MTTITMMGDQSFELMPSFTWSVKIMPSTSEVKSPIFTVADVKFSMLFHQCEDGISSLFMEQEVEDEQSTVPSYDNTTSVSIMIPGKSLEDLLCIQKTTNHNHTGSKVRHIVWQQETSFFDDLNIVQGENGQKNVTFLCIFGSLCQYQKDEGDFENSWCQYPCMETLGNDLNEMRLNKSPSFVLKCEDKTLPVHKVILSARSKKFADMFRNEKVTEKEVEIKDMEFEVLDNFITYMYSGRLKDSIPSVELLKQLYKTAIEYEVELLKKMTSYRLLEFLDKEKLSSNPEILNKEELSSNPEILNKEELSSNPEILNKEELSSNPEILEEEKLSSNPEIVDNEKLSSSPDIMEKKKLTRFFLELLSMADEFKDKSFIKSIILSIVRNNNYFIMHEEMWKEFREINKKLSMEVYDVLINDIEA